VLVIKPGTAVVEEDVVVEPASALPVRVADAAGRPLTGTWATGISPENWHRPTRVAGDACSAYHLRPGTPRLMVFYEPARKLLGTLSLRGDEKAPAKVRLGPAGAVKGRLLGEDGRPLAGVAVRVYHRVRAAEEMNEHVHRESLVETGADGKFLIEAVIPGVKFELWPTRGRRTFQAVKQPAEASAEPGKTLDLGDVMVKPEPQNGEE
jgi:hypothetical protein